MCKKLIILAIVPFFLASCGKKDEESKVVAAGIRATDVRVEIAKKINIRDEYTLPAVVEAWEVVPLASEAVGQVKAVLKSEGDKVKRGEPILKINTDTLEANLDSAKVQLESARKEFERSTNLYKQQAVSQKNFDAAVDAYKLAEVNYKLALDNYNKGVISSPIDGIIDELKPKIGEYVTTGIIVANIVQMDKLKAYLNVPEKDLPYMRVGQDVDVFPAKIGEEISKLKGVLNYLSVSSNPQSLTYKARVDIPVSSDIRPGMIVRARILRNEYKDVFVVSLYSIVDKNGQKVVYLDDNGSAKEVPVKLGTMIMFDVIVAEGLKEGDRLITSGQQFLSDKMPIKVLE